MLIFLRSQRSAGGGPAAAHFSCLAKKSKQKKATQLPSPFGVPDGTGKKMGKAESLRSDCFSDPFFCPLRRLVRCDVLSGSPSASRYLRKIEGIGHCSGDASASLYQSPMPQARRPGFLPLWASRWSAMKNGSARQSERSDSASPIFHGTPTGTPKGLALRGRLSLLTFFGEAKKVSGCRAAPGAPFRPKKDKHKVSTSA
ncbi:hypothetical protein FB597_103449 [Herbaspirillum sp. SJZ099]|nr:hypothetical protein FB597_103449 [Herbaspirillum sp. SJZ099]